MEIGLRSAQVATYDESKAEKRLLELDLVDKAQDKAMARLKAYRQQVSQTYNRRVAPRSFQVGDIIWKKA